MRTSPRCAHGSTRPTSKFLRWISSPTSDQRSRPSPAQARDGRKAGEGEASIARSLRKDPPNETTSRYLQQHYGPARRGDRGRRRRVAKDMASPRRPGHEIGRERWRGRGLEDGAVRGVRVKKKKKKK